MTGREGESWRLFPCAAPRPFPGASVDLAPLQPPQRRSQDPQENVLGGFTVSCLSSFQLCPVPTHLIHSGLDTNALWRCMRTQEAPLSPNPSPFPPTPPWAVQKMFLWLLKLSPIKMYMFLDGEPYCGITSLATISINSFAGAITNQLSKETGQRTGRVQRGGAISAFLRQGK